MVLRDCILIIYMIKRLYADIGRAFALIPSAIKHYQIKKNLKKKIM